MPLPVEQAVLPPSPAAIIARAFSADRRVLLFGQPGIGKSTFARAIKAVYVSEEIKRYIVDIVNATPKAEGVRVGASFRASLTLMHTAQALALFDDQEFVSPEQIQEIAIADLAHRLSLDPQSRFSGHDGVAIVQGLLQGIPVPG